MARQVRETMAVMMETARTIVAAVVVKDLLVKILVPRVTLLVMEDLEVLG
jgi:NifB/MoaA-like Fe-S oxidoreductase